MSQWVAGLSSDCFIISSLAAIWDYIGNDLAVVGINEDLIEQMSKYGTQTVTPVVINISELMCELNSLKLKRVEPPWISDRVLQALYYLKGLLLRLCLLAAQPCIGFNLKSSH